MTSENFYAHLPILDQFVDVANPHNYTALPDDWLVVVTDVEGSTKAIQNGRYKEVNIVGVSVITAVLNVAKPLPIPFVFGGDGATLCIPAELHEKVITPLLATKALAQATYGLNLRVGIVPMKLLHEMGQNVLVARYRVSEHYIQAVFTGGGLQQAETLVKDPVRGVDYCLEITDPHVQADFSGLECRWQNIPSRHGETISLLVSAITSSAEEDATIYRDVIAKVTDIYGSDEVCRPVVLDSLRLAFNEEILRHETNVQTAGQSTWDRFKYAFGLRLKVIFGPYLMERATQREGGPITWGQYKQAIIANTDFRKFDDMIRQVLSGTAQQREALTVYLEALYQQRKVVYGIHVSPGALMTCLIQDRLGEHFHFVDGTEGGYALAAKEMKARLKIVREERAK